MLLVFAFTLFLSACLLFFIEPMVGKMMLPLLGGTPAVWNTCMVFFQAILLAGYAFSHWSTSWLGSRRQARLQLAVLALPFLSFAINAAMFSGLLSPNDRLILGNEGNPIPALLLVLTLSVGLPMFVVCTSAPLLQRWFASTDHPAARDPYFLYGASNLGSMLMLAGYPAVVEPYLSLRGQQIVWVIGYGVLSLFVILCAFLMWKAKPAVEVATASGANHPQVPGTLPAPAQEAIKIVDHAIRAAKERREAEQKAEAGPTVRPVTWLRRMRWVALALVPSSLMLGATTYITTDIAAIPLLWVLPLTLYLLTFIIVFAHIHPRVQSIVTLASLGALLVGTIGWIAPLFIKDESMLWLVRLLGLGTLLFSFQLLRINDPKLIHRVMIMIMPLIVLLLLFMMLSEIKPGIVGNICLHLATLWIISMVCHGELALDRPEPAHLTEFFLWMSFGGVVGGLFNGLIAPVSFNSLYEYPLMMMVACLLLPPLGVGKSSVWARRADLALAAVFLVVSGILLYMCYRDKLPDLTPIKNGPWKWGLAALVLGGGLGLLAAWQRWEHAGSDGEQPEEDHWQDRTMDIVLPAALGLLVLGLYWGLPSKGVVGRLYGFADMLSLKIAQFRIILTFGLPAVLCYTFVERSIRFGLGVGAIMLAAGFCNIVDDSPVFQTRSFFGVLRVEANIRTTEGYPYAFHRLVHGTTLHGKQILDDEMRDLPLTYYHRTGPVGQVCRTYNTDPTRAIAVIGLGTGSMCTYGLKGQTMDFYDIDPLVVDIAFDTNEYFTFAEDAEARGVDVNLILGDARLTFGPKGKKTRLKPLHKRKDQSPPARQFGQPIEEDFKYGMIFVDAFSSDAIPVHLITKEAVKIYFDRLLPDGIVMMHISNRYLDLQPVLANIAEELGFVGYHMSDDNDRFVGKTKSHWVALARKKAHLEKMLHRPRWESDEDQQAFLGLALWPSHNPSMMAASGMAHIFQLLTDRQDQLAAKLEGRTGNLAHIEMPWEPLDQKSYLEDRPAELGTKIEEIDKQLDQLLKPIEQAKAAARVAEKPLKALEPERKKLDDEVKQTEAETAASTSADKVRLNKKLADLERKKLELSEREKKLKEQFEEATAPQKWLEKIEARLKERRQFYERQIRKTDELLKTARRVGVWTDDYSNILSVFGW
jgi:spermidine synthase